MLAHTDSTHPTDGAQPLDAVIGKLSQDFGKHLCPFFRPTFPLSPSSPSTPQDYDLAGAGARGAVELHGSYRVPSTVSSDWERHLRQMKKP